MRTQTMMYSENLILIYEKSHKAYRTVCMLQKHGTNDYSLSCVELDFPQNQKEVETYLVNCLIKSEECQVEGWSVRGTKGEILEELIVVFDH